MLCGSANRYFKYEKEHAIKSKRERNREKYRQLLLYIGCDSVAPDKSAVQISLPTLSSVLSLSISSPLSLTHPLSPPSL